MKKTIIVAVLLVLGLTGCTLPNLVGDQMKVVKPEQAEEQALNFINTYLVDAQTNVDISNFIEISGVYQMELNISNGQQVTAYMTKDGKYFFTEGIDMDKLIEESAQAASTPVESAQVSIEILTEGEGQEVVTGDLVTVNYEGRLEDGTVFDSSYERDEPFTVPLGQGQVIQGWEQGLIGMKVGEKRKLVIPPALGYGQAGAGGVIPPNATLIFEVELLEIRSN